MRFLLFVMTVGLSGCGGVARGVAKADGSGGQAGSGGGSGAGGGAPSECSGTVTFRIHRGQTAGTRYCSGPALSCGYGNWLGIADGAGAAIPLSLGCLQTDCAVCNSVGCPLICIPSNLQPEEEEQSWRGFTWQTGSTCANGAACSTLVCAPPGSYVARFCGYPIELVGDAVLDGGNGDCQYAAMTPTCIEVPFEYPSTTVVEGVLAP